MLENEEPVVQDAYDLVCRFYDVYFGQEIYFDLRLEETFWKMIQVASQHVIDRSSEVCYMWMDWFRNGALTCSRKPCTLPSPVIAVLHYTGLSKYSIQSVILARFFYWDDSISSQLVKVWDTFFLIYETFSEFSLHLVQVECCS